MLDNFVEAEIGGICGIRVEGFFNNANGNGDGNSNEIDNGNNNSNSNSKRSIREPASQIHEVDSPMAKHDRRSIGEPASQIWYIDANNLFGYAMMQKLRYKDFEHTNTSLYYIKYSR